MGYWMVCYLFFISASLFRSFCEQLLQLRAVGKPGGPAPPRFSLQRQGSQVRAPEASEGRGQD